MRGLQIVGRPRGEEACFALAAGCRSAILGSGPRDVVRNCFAPTFRSRADVVALRISGATYTFGDLDRRSNCVATFLLANGFSKGDRLGVYLDNRVEFLDLFLACIKTGSSPAITSLSRAEVSHIAPMRNRRRSCPQDTSPVWRRL